MIIFNEELLMTKEGKTVFFRRILFLVLAISIIILSAITFSSTCFGIVADSFIYPVGDQNIKPTKSYNSGNGYIITQDYRNIDGHTGVDLANGYSGGIVRATAAGKVVYKQESSSTSWGLRVCGGCVGMEQLKRYCPCAPLLPMPNVTCHRCPSPAPQSPRGHSAF